MRWLTWPIRWLRGGPYRVQEACMYLMLAGVVACVCWVSVQSPVVTHYRDAKVPCSTLAALEMCASDLVEAAGASVSGMTCFAIDHQPTRWFCRASLVAAIGHLDIIVTRRESGVVYIEAGGQA